MGYDITRKPSHERIAQLHQKILMARDCDVATQPPIVLLGNKNDLENLRDVTFEDGQRMASRIGATFFECSALKNYNITPAFEELTRLIRKHYNLQMGTPKPADGKSKDKKE